MPAKRKTLFGLVAVLVMLSASTGVFADESTSLEYPYVYKSTRAMGMGGAYTAVGGRVDTLFYNPAGLINIPKDKGWEINVLDLSGEESNKAQQFINDVRDAANAPDTNGDGSSSDDQLRAVNDVLASYRGVNIHLRAADFTSIGRSYDRWAFGVGAVANGRLDAISHEGFGSDGFLEVNADAYYGGIGGVSVGLTPNLFAGLSVKSLHRESLIHNFSARELIENQDNLGDYIQKDLRRSGDGFGLDAGLLWKIAPASLFRPAIGVSVMNIGNMTFGDAGTLPQSVNAGVAVTPSIPMFRSLTLAADYIDVLNNFKQDKDVGKRLRYGAELQLFDIVPFAATIRAGMYEQSPTLGCDLRLFLVTVSYAMYTEEIGAYAGQDQDKRQLLTLNIGW
jgi:hypothetical protein